MQQRPSPNHDSRRGRPVSMIVVHYTGMESAAAALDRLCDPAAKVSAHYLIEEDGALWRLVPEECRAWHAGLARWYGETDINAISIGVELQNPGHEFGYRPFPAAQIDALIELTADIRTRCAVDNHNIVGHSDVAPGRKQDPGELFPWPTLAAAGHGHWPDDNAAPVAVGDVVEALAALGYGVGDSADHPETRDSLLAFQRRFLPDRLSALADAATLRRLGQVLRGRRVT